MIEKWHHPPYKSLDKAVEAANRVSFDRKEILSVLDKLQIDEIHIGGHESPISSVMKYNGYCSSLPDMLAPLDFKGLNNNEAETCVFTVSDKLGKGSF